MEMSYLFMMISPLFRSYPLLQCYVVIFMQRHFGNLGTLLVQAAQDSDSSVATLITTQKKLIDGQLKTFSHKNSGQTFQRKRSGKKRPYRKRENRSQKPA